MKELEFGRLEAGRQLDCMVHDLILGYRGPYTEVEEYSTSPRCMALVIRWLSENTLHFGLTHSYRGYWVAVAGDAADCFAHINEEALRGKAGETHVNPKTQREERLRHRRGTRITARTAHLAVCRLAVTIGFRMARKDTVGANQPYFQWIGRDSFSDSSGGV